MEKKDYKMVNPFLFKKGYLKHLKDQREKAEATGLPDGDLVPAPHKWLDFAGYVDGGSSTAGTALRAENILMACEAIALACAPEDAHTDTEPKDSDDGDEPDWSKALYGSEYSGAVTPYEFVTAAEFVEGPTAGKEYVENFISRIGTKSEYVLDLLRWGSGENPFIEFGRVSRAWTPVKGVVSEPAYPVSVADMAVLVLAAESISTPEPVPQWTAVHLASAVTGVTYSQVKKDGEEEGGEESFEKYGRWEYVPPLLTTMWKGSPLFAMPTMAIRPVENSLDLEWKDVVNLAEELHAKLGHIDISCPVPGLTEACDKTDFAKEGESPTHKQGLNVLYGRGRPVNAGPAVVKSVGGLTFRKFLRVTDITGAGGEEDRKKVTVTENADYAGCPDPDDPESCGKCEYSYEKDDEGVDQLVRVTCTYYYERKSPDPYVTEAYYSRPWENISARGYFFEAEGTMTSNIKQDTYTISTVKSGERLRYTSGVTSNGTVTARIGHKGAKWSRFVEFYNAVLLFTADVHVIEYIPPDGTFSYDPGKNPPRPVAKQWLGKLVIPLSVSASLKDGCWEFVGNLESINPDMIYNMAEGVAGDNNFYTSGLTFVGLDTGVKIKTLA